MNLRLMKHQLFGRHTFKVGLLICWQRQHGYVSTLCPNQLPCVVHSVRCQYDLWQTKEELTTNITLTISFSPSAKSQIQNLASDQSRLRAFGSRSWKNPANQQLQAMSSRLSSNWRIRIKSNNMNWSSCVSGCCVKLYARQIPIPKISRSIISIDACPIAFRLS